MRDVDFKQFQTRCKPTSSDKCNYTLEERKKDFRLSMLQ